MNRSEAKSKLIDTFKNIPFSELKIGDLNNVIDKIYDDLEKDLKDINNQVSRLKKQLSKDHHVECSCSFCKPVVEKINKLNCIKCKHYYTEYKFDLLFDKCNLKECNWELEC